MSEHRSLVPGLVAPALLVAAALVAAVALGCTGAGPAGSPAGGSGDPVSSDAAPPPTGTAPAGTAAGAGPSQPVGSPPAETTQPGASQALPLEPPAAALAAEGGDPVTAQLGTYTWGDGGSDSPWLPGAPITVGAGEPLVVSFDPPLVPSSWLAILAAPDADGPAGARPLAEGLGSPILTAPAPGRYTLALTVTVEGQGTAHYAWMLEVR